MALPNFTDDQRRRLAKLGVLPEQVERLRHALVEVKRALRPPAARNDTKRVMTDVAKHADALVRILGNSALQSDAAHAEVNRVIEEAYWMAFPDDDGAWSAHHMLPRLKVLADAARDALATIPKDQTRVRASGRPIVWIDRALFDGWIRAQGPREVRVIDGEEWEAALPPYPDIYHPHESKTFVEIVAICYEAAGAARHYEPLAAIRACVQGKKRQHDELLQVVTAAIDAATPSRKVRASAKRARRQ